jgi:hypothetical protein
MKNKITGSGVPQRLSIVWIKSLLASIVDNWDAISEQNENQHFRNIASYGCDEGISSCHDFLRRIQEHSCLQNSPAHPK